MSTVVVLNLAGSGHINPSLPLVAGLVEQGEKVIYYSTAPYQQVIEHTGAEYRPYAHPETLIPKAHQGAFFSVMAHFAHAAKQNMPALLSELQADPPDYLLVDSMCLWGNLIQQILDVPAVMFSSIFIMPPQWPAATVIDITQKSWARETLVNGLKSFHTYFEIAQKLDRQYGTQCPGLVESFSNPQGLNLLFASRNFHPAVEMFDEERYKFIGPSVAVRSEAVAFPFDQLGKEPIIYISLGTINTDFPDFFKDCFAAFDGLPYQVIMSIGNKIDPAMLGTPPTNFIVQPYVPQLEILKHVSLFITHGGMNSTCEALWQDVPLIVIPRRGDQFLVAQQVVAAGAGLHLATSEVTPEILRSSAVEILSNSQYKQQAQLLGQSFRDAGGYRRGVEEIFAYKQRVGLSKFRKEV